MGFEHREEVTDSVRVQLVREVDRLLAGFRCRNQSLPSRPSPTSLKLRDIRGHNVGHPQLGIRADGPILPHKTITRIAPGHLPQVSDIPRCDRLGVLVLDDLLLLP